jgi:putative oxidoreductase
MRAFVAWVLSVLLALTFFSMGVEKLMDEPMMAGLFRLFGYPPWSMTLVGAVEIVGAAFVLIPRLAHVGAFLLGCVMVGAIFSHLTHGQAYMVAGPALLLAMAVALGALRHWGRTKPHLRRVRAT